MSKRSFVLNEDTYRAAILACMLMASKVCFVYICVSVCKYVFASVCLHIRLVESLAEI